MWRTAGDRSRECGDRRVCPGASTERLPKSPQTYSAAERIAGLWGSPEWDAIGRTPTRPIVAERLRLHVHLACRYLTE
jgi:hypothetical protein